MTAIDRAVGQDGDGAAESDGDSTGADGLSTVGAEAPGLELEPDGPHATAAAASTISRSSRFTGAPPGWVRHRPVTDRTLEVHP